MLKMMLARITATRNQPISILRSSSHTHGVNVKSGYVAVKTKNSLITSCRLLKVEINGFTLLT